MKILAFLLLLAPQLVEVNQAKIEALEEDFVYVRDNIDNMETDLAAAKDDISDIAVAVGRLDERTKLILQILAGAGLLGAGGGAVKGARYYMRRGTGTGG